LTSIKAGAVYNSKAFSIQDSFNYSAATDIAKLL